MSKHAAAGAGELEFEVLECLWQSGPLTTRAVFEAVGEPRSLAYTTILTVLQRLHRKGWATRDDRDRTHIYAAALPREEFAAKRAAGLAQNLARLGAVGVPAFLSHAERIDPALVETLRRNLTER